ncbi:MAG: hypothetical protein ACSLEY_02935 [Candidatus Saccharimonadales bacterium]
MKKHFTEDLSTNVSSEELLEIETGVAVTSFADVATGVIATSQVVHLPHVNEWGPAMRNNRPELDTPEGLSYSA